MINIPCGWDWKRRLIKHGGCGVRLGYEPIPPHGFLPIIPYTPFFHQGVPYCCECRRGFDVRHLGQGVCVRPQEEGDDVPVAGPGLEELYS